MRNFELDDLFDHHFFSSLDYFFARAMAKAFDETDSVVLSSCALVSKLLFEGHICLDLGQLSETTLPISETGHELVKFPDLTSWVRALKKSSMVSDSIQTPLVLDSDHRLYLARYYDFQNRLTQNISQRVFLTPCEVDEAFFDEILAPYFSTGETGVNPQENAVKHAIRHHFTIVSGGPGTGKTHVTTIIKKIFMVYSEKHGLPIPKIECVAPTGKAASKMEQGSTIHSLLRPMKNKVGFVFHKNNLLQVDMIIIDEGSMIDIVLMTRLLEAVPMTAKVIILGDHHQLSSIQAGSVFRDICSAKGLSDNLFVLEYNFRSKGKTGIENLSRAINHNHVKAVETILTSSRYPDIVFVPLKSDIRIDSCVNRFILEGYQAFLAADTVEATLNDLDAFKILCAHNFGEYGTLQINHLCEKILRAENNFDMNDTHKKIIMVKTNDYKKGLFNGDTGIVFEKKEGSNAFFKTADNTIKRFRASDLTGSDTAFAITVHKSQGSEFNTVLMILPDKISPVVTRQLLYTGITRAKNKVILVGNIDMIKKAITVSVKRNSGLSACLEKEFLT